VLQDPDSGGLLQSRHNAQEGHCVHDGHVCGRRVRDEEPAVFEAGGCGGGEH